MIFLIICHFIQAQKVSINNNLMHEYIAISIMFFWGKKQSVDNFKLLYD